MAGIDILDQRDPLGKPLTGSLLFHGGLLALILATPYLVPHTVMLGDPNHHSGTIGVSVVKTVPIPQREGPVNRVANDTQATAPQKPEPKVEPKPVVKEKLPPPDAIAIPEKKGQTQAGLSAQPRRIPTARTSPTRRTRFSATPHRP